VPVCEALLFSEVRLFTKDTHLDSITVGLKLVEDVEYLIDIFKYFSNDQCFQSIKAIKGQLLKRKREGGVLQYFPSWLKPYNQNTIYQWLIAFLEYLIVSRYLLCEAEGEAALIKKELESDKTFFVQAMNISAMWKDSSTSTKRRVLYYYRIFLGLN
jgi:hypothetical protein